MQLCGIPLHAHDDDENNVDRGRGAIDTGLVEVGRKGNERSDGAADGRQRPLIRNVLRFISAEAVMVFFSNPHLGLVLFLRIGKLDESGTRPEEGGRESEKGTGYIIVLA